jgi:uncharacterized membrane-anchored protein YitT (DUF2179 family)
MKVKTERLTKPAIDYAVIFLGTLLSGASAALFYKPLAIPMGGVNGISQILNYLTTLPIGVGTIVANIPLLLLAYRHLGHRFLFKTAVAVILSSVSVDVLSYIAGDFLVTENVLLAALYAGVLGGAGLGLVFSRGGTLGGSDIVSKLVNKKRPHFSVGKISLAVNALVIIAAAAVFKKPEAALYAIVAQYVAAALIDAILGGFDHARMALLVTGKPEEISEMVLKELSRGCTGYNSRGMYTHAEHTTVLVVVRANEVSLLKAILNKTDPNAFMVELNAREVFGRGFKSYGA